MTRFAKRLTGGCLCGAIRYSIGGYSSAVHCHCGMCRRATGAPFATWVSLPRSRFRLETEPPPAYRSSPEARRSYCAACGSQLFMAYGDDDEISVSLGTLDDPSAIEIGANIFAGGRLAQVRGFDAELRDWEEFEERTQSRAQEG